MHLDELAISNCFGFGKATVTLQQNLVYILGRNSSGKTALLDAINGIAPQRLPQDHPRFANFRPTISNPQLSATFSTKSTPRIPVRTAVAALLLQNGLPAKARDDERVEEALTKLQESYDNLADEIASAGTLKVIKFGARECQLMAGDEFKEATERRNAIDLIIARLLPGSHFDYVNTKHAVSRPTATDIDRIAAGCIPPITYYNQQYSLIDDLPDRLTHVAVGAPPNNVTRAFVELLYTDDLNTLFTTNDPDDQYRLQSAMQRRVESLATTISTDSNRLVQITLSMTANGLQITLRTDGKKSFYRHLSDATKFLIAYHLYALQHPPGAILLFDEPSRGLHASSEPYLREFLRRLATENHVIVSTHSERLIDLDQLDGIRLMQQDDDDRPVVLNSLRPPRDRANYLLALQPIFDAIGLAHGNHLLTNDRVVLTEGLTDYLYLRAFLNLTGATPSFGIAPGRGESTLLVLAPFMASQGVSIKIVIDHPAVQEKLEEAYGIPETAFFLIPTANPTRGIEDLFTPNDYLRLLASSGYEVSNEDLKIGNSGYAKKTNKRLVAQTFLSTIASYTLDSFEVETRSNIDGLLMFCTNNEWFKI